jgi:hypothetical protein
VACGLLDEMDEHPAEVGVGAVVEAAARLVEARCSRNDRVGVLAGGAVGRDGGVE